MLVSDVDLTTNGWIDLIIQGSEDYTITGMQSKLDELFPDKGIVAEFANDGYLLPLQSNYGRELSKPFVAVSCRFKVEKPLFWRDKVPKSEDYIAWSEDLSLRFDIWGRTPPETRDVSDGVWDCLKLIKNPLWDGTRAKLAIEGETENYVDKLEGVPDLWHRSINVVLTVFKKKEVD